MWTRRGDTTIILVYITEAHAADVWPIGLAAGVINYAHKKLEDRIDCARKMASAFDVKAPLFVDGIDNAFETDMAAWPVRFWVVENRRFQLIGQPEDSSFDFCILEKYLKA